MSERIQHVFLVGAKSIGAYGGYETFVDKLTEYHKNNNKVRYHVACKGNGEGCMNLKKTVGAVVTGKNTFTYHNAECFLVSIPEKIGHAQAIYYDIKSLEECCKIIKDKKIKNAVVYIMACRIGPFMKHFYKKIHRLGGRVYLNPDGHEWMRGKWSAPIRRYWKISEQMMVKWSDLVVCDSVNIEKYIHECYDGKGINGRNPETTFIAYGAETRPSRLSGDDERLVEWYKSKGLKPKEYYLVVGRFVPENNFEIMIREFMRSDSKKDFAIITTANDGFLNELEEKLHFKNDPRIKFVGTLYDQELLKKVRENAYGYFHGHEVGGTNPSLLEALGSTSLNLLLDVGFNREVAEDAAVYWSKEEGSLAELINNADKMKAGNIIGLGKKAKARVMNAYSWEFITKRYETAFLYGAENKVKNEAREVSA
jgi:rhamnosyltransferase